MGQPSAAISSRKIYSKFFRIRKKLLVKKAYECCWRCSWGKSRKWLGTKIYALIETLGCKDGLIWSCWLKD